MDETELHFADLRQAGAALRAGSTTAVELTTHLLERIAALDGGLHAYQLLLPECALAEAARADAELYEGIDRGPLHGIPVAVKDVFDVAGYPTTAGMPLRAQRAEQPAEHLAETDATVVTRLRDAGAVLLGTLRTTEGAWFEHHPSVAAPVNPWAVDQWPGTSSSGSDVATAAGLCFASIGTDTGGSIRFPSAQNALTGLKPTRGRVSRSGAFPLADSLDHVGPMCRAATDVAVVLRAIAGHDPHDPTTLTAAVPDYLGAPSPPTVQGLRLGLDPDYVAAGVDGDVVAAVLSAADVLTGLGAQVTAVTMPPTGPVCAAWTPIAAVEAALAHAEWFPSRAAEYGPLGRLLGYARHVSAAQLLQAQRVRAEFTRALDTLFEHVDVLLMPTVPRAGLSLADVEELVGSREAMADYVRFAIPFDMSGHPALAVPGGCTAAGLPVSVQLVSRSLAESLLLRTAYTFQGATDWHTRHPSI